MRILDVFEVAEVEVWPLWDLAKTKSKNQAPAAYEEASKKLDAYEYSAYRKAVDGSKFRAVLNEKIPPISDPIELPESSGRYTLISDETREERGHPDVRIARRAETLARLAAVAHERGTVSLGLRRVLVIQAVRLAYKAAERFNYANGAPSPDPDVLLVTNLIGSVLTPTDDEGVGP